MVGWRRRRRELNRALHELRRPLQALTLLEGCGGPPPSSGPAAARRGLIELAGLAAGDLDRAVNGGSRPPARRPVSSHELVLASLERQRPAAGETDSIRVFWDAGPAMVEGEPARVAQAIDNLLANALEHGEPPVVITGATVAGRLRITVANAAEPPAASPDGTEAAGAPRSRGRRDPRRGHGVSVVSEIAADHQGRFALCRTGTGCVAALELPLADLGAAQAV
jgi:signal transduction histidine kinase